MMDRTTPLYYESHITIDPVFDDLRAQAGRLAIPFNFRLAKLILRKSYDDKGISHTDDTFMTGHSINLEDIQQRTRDLVTALQSTGFVVRRYKIEETVCDSRTEDVMGLLG